MADGDLLFVCGCGVASPLSGRATVWDSRSHAWRHVIWPVGPASVTVNSEIPVAGCPCCLERCDFGRTLPASNIPVIVNEHLQGLHAGDRAPLVAVGGPLASESLPEPVEC